MTLLWVLIWVLSGGVVGYALGRRLGQREGRRQGNLRVPLMLRAQALQTGICPVCDTSIFSPVGEHLHAHTLGQVHAYWKERNRQIDDVSGNG